MVIFDWLIIYFRDFFYGFSDFTSVLTTQIWEGFSPLTILLPVGLITFLGVAIIKWAIS